MGKPQTAIYNIKKRQIILITTSILKTANIGIRWKCQVSTDIFHWITINK